MLLVSIFDIIEIQYCLIHWSGLCFITTHENRPSAWSAALSFITLYNYINDTAACLLMPAGSLSSVPIILRLAIVNCLAQLSQPLHSILNSPDRNFMVMLSVILAAHTSREGILDKGLLVIWSCGIVRHWTAVTLWVFEEFGGCNLIKF